MIFKRFFFRRQQANATPDLSRPSSEDEGPRYLQPYRHLNNLEELRTLVQGEPNAAIREIALARYRQLLCGQETPPLDLRVRKAEVGGLEDQSTLAHVAGEAKESEIRLAAIEHLTDQAALADRALGDAATGVRVAAAQRLQDREALERVARGIGKKDKNVYRLVHARLRELAEQEERPARVRAQCQDLCAKLAALGRFENWSQDRALLDLLDRQWGEVAEQADQEWQDRYRQERERFLAAYASYQQSQSNQIAAEEAESASQSAREALIAALAPCLTLSDEAILRDRLQDIQAGWQALGLPPGGMARRYQAALVAAETRLVDLAREHQTQLELSAWLAQAREVLDQSRPIEHRRLTSLLSQVQDLPPLMDPDQGLLATIDDVRTQLADRQRRQLRHAEQRLAQASGKLTELEAAFAAGELKRAEPLFQSLQAAIESAVASGLPLERTADIKRHLQVLTPRLRDLQKWRRWGADTHREGLCQAMEQLESSDIPLAIKAGRLHELRVEWKELERDGAPANHPLWERFASAADRVHALCKPWLEQRSREREEARAAREALCAQLEDFLDRVDWGRVDWRQAQRAEREMREGWENLGEVEDRHRRGLERRFRTALKRLDDRLSVEREANQRLKHELIARIEALATSPDLERAIEETKRLQSEWRTTVAARQRDENRLWQQFRAACDVVFERRRQRHEAQVAELGENLRLREAIRAEAEALARAESGATADCQDVLPALEARWQEAARLPVPRQASAELERGWRQALHQIQTARQERMKARHRQTLDLLASQAQVCSELEQALERGGDVADAITMAEVQWLAMGPHPEDHLRQGMEARFQRARAAALAGNADLGAQGAANPQERAEICLRLEILAQIDSPPEYAAERLAFQVNRLQEHLASGEENPQATSAHLIEQWFLVGPAPAAEAAGLERRFERARAALSQIEATNPRA